MGHARGALDSIDRYISMTRELAQAEDKMARTWELCNLGHMELTLSREALTEMEAS